MSRLIDAEVYEQSLIENGWDEGDDEFFPDGLFELLKETPTVNAIPLDKIKQAREEIKNINEVVHDGQNHYYKDCADTKTEVLAILDKLIESEEK